ncbi:viral A-type inclusion protein [Spirosoma agri]|uniref:Viral A-type inclusion protein n=1 Tax=Spirosoma agri TaxID=1987381 RepID=A0A6M0II12_9BACT|nr:viral A-type inclusion protein [Spirosoma agri]NEU67325.1 viral A-type inclusion protein [Spirosoma agri]
MRKPSLFFFSFLVLSGSFWACTKSGEETVKQAENDVFAIHDDVMPLLDDVMKMRKLVKARIVVLDSTKAAVSAASTLRIDEERDQAKRIVQNLTDADSLMMSWMDHYKNDTLAKLPSDDALRYLDQQKDLITDVKAKVNSSLKEAVQFLQKP